MALTVIHDPGFAFVMIMWSLWPILVSLAAKYHGMHLPMSDERVMFMSNYLLTFYYFWITISYIVVLRYAMWWTPHSVVNWWEPQVWVNGQPQQLIFAHLAGLMHDGKWMFSVFDNMTLYLLTCCAVGDFFIVTIVSEHKYAYQEILEGRDSSVITQQASVGKTFDPISAIYRAEREMIEDWCQMIGDSEGKLQKMAGWTGGDRDEEELDMDPVPSYFAARADTFSVTGSNTSFLQDSSALTQQISLQTIGGTPAPLPQALQHPPRTPAQQVMGQGQAKGPDLRAVASKRQ